MDFTHKCMKNMMERINEGADQLWTALQADDQIDRCCSCGADKRIEAIWAQGDGMYAMPQARRLLNADHDTITNNQLEMILGYALAKYPPEKCDDGCPHSHEWAAI